MPTTFVVHLLLYLDYLLDCYTFTLLLARRFLGKGVFIFRKISIYLYLLHTATLLSSLHTATATMYIVLVFCSVHIR